MSSFSNTLKVQLHQIISKLLCFIVENFFLFSHKRKARRHKIHPTSLRVDFLLTRFCDFLQYFVKIHHNFESVLERCERVLESHWKCTCAISISKIILFYFIYNNHQFSMIVMKDSHLSRARDMNEWKWEAKVSSLCQFFIPFFSFSRHFVLRFRPRLFNSKKRDFVKIEAKTKLRWLTGWMISASTYSIYYAHSASMIYNQGDKNTLNASTREILDENFLRCEIFFIVGACIKYCILLLI